MTQEERRPDEVPPDLEAMRDFDDVARLTARVVHWAKWGLVAGLPIWLILLLLVPQSGLGAIGSLSLSTLVTVLVVIGAERLGARLRGRDEAAGTAPVAQGPGVRRHGRRPMSAAKAVLLTLGGVALFAYAVFIIAIIVRGG